MGKGSLYSLSSKKKKKEALIIVETVGECNRDLADFCAHVITIEKQSANRRL